jgi:hypothetical protein
MICQRSGRCCITSFVVVVVQEKGEWRVKSKPPMVRCPNLTILQDGEAYCNVHNEPWYKDTPCYSHGNPELDIDHAANPSRPCAIGKMLREHNRDVLHDVEPGVLEDLGPFKSPVWPAE